MLKLPHYDAASATACLFVDRVENGSLFNPAPLVAADLTYLVKFS